MNFLITGGPTVEDIDPVRFISNRASGRMGFALARAAAKAGHRVTLIHGPVSSDVLKSAPKGVPLVAVRSTASMREAVFKHVKNADVVIMNAAVADFTPLRFSKGKLKKSEGLVLKLKPTPDILKELGRYKRTHKNLFLVGFALETGTGRTPQALRRSALREAFRKLEAKNLDAIVLNSPKVIGATSGGFEILTRNGPLTTILPTNMEKDRFAEELVKLAGSLSVKSKDGKRP